MTNTNKKLTVRELIAILKTHNPDAIINVRDEDGSWSEITIHDVTTELYFAERGEYVLIGE